MGYTPKRVDDSICTDDMHRTIRRSAGRPRVLEEHQRRERILDAACDAIGECGFHAMSMDKVASTSGMSKKTIYEVFPSKQSLFEAAIEDRLLCFHRLPRCYAGSLENQLVAQLIDIADILLGEAQLGLMRAIVSEVPKSADIRDFFTTTVKGTPENSPLANWFEKQKNAGQITIDDPTEAARYVFGMTVGELTMSALTGCYEPLDRSKRDAYIRTGVRIFLRGIACQFSAEQKRHEP